MFLGVLTVLVLLALGMLNAQTFVSQKHEKLKEIIEKLLPFEGYIGLAGIAFGLLGILNTIGNIGYIGGAPMYFLLGLIAGALTFVLGVLSSAALIKQQVLSGNANLSGKLDQFIAKIQPHQMVLGLSGIGVAALFFIIVVLA